MDGSCIIPIRFCLVKVKFSPPLSLSPPTCCLSFPLSLLFSLPHYPSPSEGHVCSSRVLYTLKRVYHCINLNCREVVFVSVTFGSCCLLAGCLHNTSSAEWPSCTAQANEPFHWRQLLRSDGRGWWWCVSHPVQSQGSSCSLGANETYATTEVSQVDISLDFVVWFFVCLCISL